MKKTFIFSILLILNSVSFSTQNYWIRVSSPTPSELYKCAFPDSMNIWAGGDSGVIIHSSNGGINWFTQNSTLSIEYRFVDLYFLNNRLGWGITFNIANGSSAMIKTTNSGNNWINTNIADTNINTVYFIDSLNGFYGEIYGGLIYKTTNSGTNWAKCTIESNLYTYFPKNKFIFTDTQHGLCVGGARDAGGPMWRTIDGGLNWFMINNAGEPVNDAAYSGPNTIIGTGGDFDYGISIEVSSNNGTSWDNFYAGYICVGMAVAPRTPADIWIASGTCAGWEVSFDSAKTWDTVRVGNNISINDVKFCDQFHGWSVGAGGALYKFNRDMIGIKNIHYDLPTTFILYQNYPNPFNPTTNIKYSVTSNVKSETSNVKLIIYDILGKEVATLVNEKFNAGTYSVTFDGSSYATGVYFYQLISDGNIIDTKKMVIVK